MLKEIKGLDPKVSKAGTQISTQVSWTTAAQILMCIDE